MRRTLVAGAIAALAASQAAAAGTPLRLAQADAAAGSGADAATTATGAGGPPSDRAAAQAGTGTLNPAKKPAGPPPNVADPFAPAQTATTPGTGPQSPPSDQSTQAAPPPPTNAAKPGTKKAATGAAGTRSQSGPSFSSGYAPATRNRANAPAASGSAINPSYQLYGTTQRNNPFSSPGTLAPVPGQYGGTQSTLGVLPTTAAPAYGGTQRDSVGSQYGDLRANGVPTYTGTQSTLSPSGQSPTSDTQNASIQPYGGTQPSPGTQPLGGTPLGASHAPSGQFQGNGTDYSRAPLGAAPITRDQHGTYGAVGSYNAQGVYTGTAAQPYNYGQVYATTNGIRGGLIGTGADATGPLRPVIPTGNGPIRPNSGYGLPNGSRPTTMDARGIQRMQ